MNTLCLILYFPDPAFLSEIKKMMEDTWLKAKKHRRYRLVWREGTLEKTEIFCLREENDSRQKTGRVFIYGSLEFGWTLQHS